METGPQDPSHPYHPTPLPRLTSSTDLPQYLPHSLPFPSQIVPSHTSQQYYRSWATSEDYWNSHLPDDMGDSKPSGLVDEVSQPLVTEDFLPSLTVNSELDKHQVTGSSILAPGTISDSNGRTYQGYREGKYFLPNDPVSTT